MSDCCTPHPLCNAVVQLRDLPSDAAVGEPPGARRRQLRMRSYACGQRQDGYWLAATGLPCGSHGLPVCHGGSTGSSWVRES